MARLAQRNSPTAAASGRRAGDGLVCHLEWRRCAALGELDCRHCGGRVELRRLPRRHAQLKAGEPARADLSPGSGAIFLFAGIEPSCSTATAV